MNMAMAIATAMAMAMAKAMAKALAPTEAHTGPGCLGGRGHGDGARGGKGPPACLPKRALKIVPPKLCDTLATLRRRPPRTPGLFADIFGDSLNTPGCR